MKVCIGSACHLKGSYEVLDRLQQLVKEYRLADRVTVKASFCLGHCSEQGVSVELDGQVHGVPVDGVEAFFREQVLGGAEPGRFQILLRQPLNDEVTRMDIYAPLIARKAKAGQFIILRTDAAGERIPLTIADHDAAAGTVTVIYQKVGATTLALDEMREGDCLADFVGPLGKPTELAGIRRAAVVGGGLGCAIAYPIAKALHEMGAQVDMIAGFRTEGLIILKDEMKAASSELYLCTDDGSYGRKGFVTDQLRELIESGVKYDCVFAIGPLPMMKFVSRLTAEFGVKTIVSMNSIMVDGTGMCGGCRVTVGGKIKFACVDGPDFDGHEVDFDEAIQRNAAYKSFEAGKVREHNCRLGLNQ